MSTAEANALWATRIVDACVAAGVGHAFLSPGSRNTPLLLAFRQAGVPSTVVVDERSSGFVALGWMRSSGLAAALVSTSGSAPFHYGPAVAEADASSLPLLVLSADRPERLRHCGSMQTSLQAKMLPELFRSNVDLPAPVDGSESLVSCEHALATLGGAYPGPVSINVQFEEPLWDASIDRASATDHFEQKATLMRGVYDETDRLPDHFFDVGRRGVISVGPPADGLLSFSDEVRTAIRSLASRLGWPVLAELHSSLRESEQYILEYPDLTTRLLGDSLHQEPPQSVLHFGLFPTSKNVQGVLRAAQNVVHVDTRPGLRLPLDGNLSTYRAAPQSLLACAEFSEQDKSTTWTKRWFDTDRRISEVLEKLPRETLFEPNVARALFGSMNDGALLVVANSMPIRQTDVWLGYGTRDRITSVARGVSGIDGTISAALGSTLARSEPVWVFLGDLAFLHDVGALALVKELNAPLNLVVSDNRGGGIFRRLPIAKHPEAFESHFITAQKEVDLASAARGFGVAARDVESFDELKSALEWAAKETSASVIVVKTNSEFDVAEERRVVSALQEALQ
ncbi:MAG: 2-succinyl-5-enolpyruvyl-6-hydroxy-3-cyclohexene-1-carboxylic-acid synthase [Myxococcota bacterium]|nr:2-succinyl-5-enolpyruvyl-6-hydroxy-3-cyclohexene-1-carboxylic-acid synthase [Myxococcota bacterium]